jgi:DNA mismatch endonuclease, patch repair protein
MAKIKCVSMTERAAKPLMEERAGCRLRHQPCGLLGHPDFANKSKKVGAFFMGCYWHRCTICRKDKSPGSAFWLHKFAYNEARHSYVTLMLEAMGYIVVVVWEHEYKEWLKQKRAENRRAAATVGEPGGRSATRRPRRI